MTMRTAQVFELVGRLPTPWLKNYEAAFEARRLQKFPQAKFVNRAGECCPVCAMAGATSVEELVGSEIWPRIMGSELEELSRRFEGGRLTAGELYDEVVLTLVARSAETAAR
jgi:hypothetical protein